MFFLDQSQIGGFGIASAGRAAGAAFPTPKRVTVLLPFFNERDFITTTIDSLAGQTVPFRLVLIDNGSTDGSGPLAAGRARTHGIDHIVVRELRPGKVAALQAGLARVTTPLVATCDADCWYPPAYLARAAAVLDDPGVAISGAFYAARDATATTRQRLARHVLIAQRFLPHQSHTGGAGQVFRTDALRRVGGFDPAIWNWVLEDHEIIARLLSIGRMAFAEDLWCSPSPRARNRPSIRWTLAERLRYHVTPARAQLGFFHNWLAPRLLARRLTSDRIRETPFQPQEPCVAATRSVC